MCHSATWVKGILWADKMTGTSVQTLSKEHVSKVREAPLHPSSVLLGHWRNKGRCLIKGWELTHVFFSFLSFSCFLSLFLFLLLPLFLTFP